MGSVAEGNILLIMMRETLMAVIIRTLAKEGGVEVVGHCPSSLLESVEWRWRRRQGGRKGRMSIGGRSAAEVGRVCG